MAICPNRPYSEEITPDSLPQSPNLHYLGQKQYELPPYLANWDVAMLPFAQNASTRFISPTKTPEYLAAGRATVSTPIPDVIDPYGLNGLAEIAQDAEEFQRAIERLLKPRPSDWLERVDAYLRISRGTEHSPGCGSTFSPFSPQIGTE